MNLEDRLRSHLHSGEDLFVEGERDSADIAVAGHRRTRRNQMAGGGVACLAVLGLVFGAASLQDSGTDRLATQGAATEATAEAGEAATGAFDGSVSFDVITGMGDGFVGLRNRDGAVTAMTSDDGVNWNERRTDLPAGTSGISLAHGDGLFAASIQTPGDPSPEQVITSIATSTDLESWTVVEVVAPDGVDVSLLRLSVDEGMVVAPITLFPRRAVEAESEALPVEQSAVLVGPAGGPYELTETTDLFTFSLGVAATNTGVAGWVMGDNGFSIITLDESGGWKVVALPDPELALTGISTVDGDLLVFGTRDRYESYRSPDNGFTWSQIDLPPDLVDVNWQGTTPHSSDRTAVVRLTGPGDNGPTRTALLVSRGDAFSEVDLTAHMTTEQIENSMLVATSDEEALFVFFGTPSNDPSLASSSGLAPDDAPESAASEGASTAPGYISVPLS